MTRPTLLSATLLVLGSGPGHAQDSRLVEAGGLRLEMIVHPGPGPTVVFDGGATAGMEGWMPIRDAVGRHAGTVLFQRAGFGRSDMGPEPRTAHRFAAELRAALLSADVELPVVLVSYSLGGILAMGFADLYPEDLAGLVFIDPATDRSYQRQFDERPHWLADLMEEVACCIEGVPPGWRGQMEALPQSILQLRDFGPLEGVPTVVLTAMTGRGEWPKETERDMQEWREDHQTLVSQIPGAMHVVLTDATHGSIASAREVVESILQVVEASRR